mmetsp:Transcript_27450/g.76963  ORF Transcript_27450/g.76963 Transcript_27450/m.76963 type:complete len:159 (+) Transcript_27450:16-492(+)
MWRDVIEDVLFVSLPNACTLTTDATNAAQPQYVPEQNIINNRPYYDDDDESVNYDDTDPYEGSLILPRSHHPKIPNKCVICLEAYQPNDVVVWSCGDADCQHAFHRSCVIKYLVRIHKKAGCTPCPCCRRDFTNLIVPRRRRDSYILQQLARWSGLHV